MTLRSKVAIAAVVLLVTVVLPIATGDVYVIGMWVLLAAVVLFVLLVIRVAHALLPRPCTESERAELERLRSQR
jgi:Ca2+/Na+ antiporter